MEALTTCDNIIIGAGPAGLNMAMEFSSRGLPYLLLERGSCFGGQFWQRPRCGELISLNKRTLPAGHPGWSYARRYDWHTLSTVTEADSAADEKLLFTTWTPDLFPKAHTFAEYLDFVGHHPRWGVGANTRFGCAVQRISRDGSRLLVETAEGPVFAARRLFMALGAARPIIPDIPGLKEFGTLYDEFDPADVARYRGKRVVILGTGNSGFEIANALKETAGDTLLLTRSEVRFARQTHNVHDVRTQTSVSYDLAQLKSLTTISAERVTAVSRHPSGRLLLKTSTPEPHWERPAWRNRDLLADEVVVCCGFDYTLRHLFTANVAPALAEGGQYCALTSTWESVSEPGVYFIGGAMRVNDKAAASGFVHGFRYNVQALAALIAEEHYAQPLKPLWQCELLSGSSKHLDTSGFGPLCTFVTRLVSHTASLFELFEYGCCTITLRRHEDAVTAEVWDTLPRSYAQSRWGADPNLAGRVEIVFQYGFRQYGEHIPSHHFTHPSDHFHTERGAYIHPVLHAFHYTVAGAPEKAGEWHMQESLLARWDQDDYADEGTNTQQYANAVFNAVAAALGLEERRSTLPVHEQCLEEQYPQMTPAEVVQALQAEPGLRLIAEAMGKRGVGSTNDTSATVGDSGF